MNDTWHPVLILHRDDLEARGYNTSDLSEEDLRIFAKTVGKVLMEWYWDVIDNLADDLPKRKNDN